MINFSKYISNSFKSTNTTENITTGNTVCITCMTLSFCLQALLLLIISNCLFLCIRPKVQMLNVGGNILSHLYHYLLCLIFSVRCESPKDIRVLRCRE